MRRAFALVMLLLMLGSGTGAFAVLAESAEICSDECGGCGDESHGGRCAPVCGTCLCAARGVSLLLAAAVAVPVAERAAEVAVPEASARPPAPDPQEILHVPRRAG